MDAAFSLHSVRVFFYSFSTFCVLARLRWLSEKKLAELETNQIHHIIWKYDFLKKLRQSLCQKIAARIINLAYAYQRLSCSNFAKLTKN